VNFTRVLCMLLVFTSPLGAGRHACMYVHSIHSVIVYVLPVGDTNVDAMTAPCLCALLAAMQGGGSC
jgi:hypothetical protein